MLGVFEMRHENPNFSMIKQPHAGDRETRTGAFISKRKRRENCENG
ncbi:MAG: hypothetical protein IKJ65_01635 [Clostridia bacterium]|nr:hypothetical protein [Clostridia bacterium]